MRHRSTEDTGEIQEKATAEAVKCMVTMRHRSTEDTGEIQEKADG
jgi:hypothetical protein